jgi:choline-sulfatase
MRMVRRGRHKACFAPPHRPVLFDLQEDPHEWNDLGGDPSSRDRIDDLYEAACADGWDGEALREEILVHKRRLSFIDRAETQQSPSASTES